MKINVKIPLDRIILDKSIIEAVKKFGGTIGKVRYDPNFTTPLNRMQILVDLYNEGIEFPAVILSPVRNTGYYIIIDGRQKIAISILLGKKEILANIV